ncbi:MAG: hypothetical protein DMF78_15905 [Acidobacteria bacterium]|nr:MAG: hypothetical protein DMF78_15905 [Acidobacteriota bacterium]
MTRSRTVVLGSALIVGAGALVALGAIYLDPARAAVGPLPPQALSLPAGTRFVMGLDVKRFVASPFYTRYSSAAGASARPQAFAELEEKTGLNPERDIDQVYVAGGQVPSGPRGADGLVVVTGRFDRYKVARAIETERKGVTSKTVQGITVYLFNEDRSGRGTGAVAFLDDSTIVLGAQSAVEQTVAARARGDVPLRSNTMLLGLIEGVKPGSTFWMVGDQTLLANLPKTIPAPGGPGSSQSLELPALKSLVVTGDLDPQVSLDLTGDTADEAAAKNLADVVRGLVALASLQANQKPELKQLASAVSVSTEATRVHVAARFPYELLDSIQPRSAPASASQPSSTP